MPTHPDQSRPGEPPLTPPASAAPQAGSKPEAIAQVVRSLTRLRARVRALLLAQRVLLVLAVALGAVIAIGAADYVLRTPAWFRAAIWAVGLSVLAWAVVNVIGPAFRFRPPLSEIALRVERGPAGERAGLRGVLTAGVELAAARERGDLGGASARLAEPVIAAAARGYSQVRARDVLSGARAGRSAACFGAAAAMLAILLVLAPALVGIGAARVLMPWSDAQWPKRTAVADATGAAVHPLGEALALRAVVARRGGEPQAAAASRVRGMYRLIDEQGRAGPVKTVLLTAQDRAADMPARDSADPGAPARGMLFERLIEPAVLTAGGERREGTLEYWFETEDDRTPVASVRLVNPPAVLAARAEVTPPAYAASTHASGAGSDEPRSLDLGPGSDERAAPPAMLAGSRIRLNLILNKPVPAPPAADENAAARRAWLAATLGEDVAKLADERAVWTSFEGELWTLEWVLRETARLPVRVTDEFGIASVEESVYRFEAVADAAPTVTVTEPESDRTVLPTASINVRGEGRDDVALAFVALERRRATRPAGSEGAPAEPTEEWAAITRTDAAAAGDGAAPAAARQMTVAARVDLSELNLKPGDELWLSAVAGDRFELDGERHEPSRSGVRRLVIISEEEFAAQVLAELGSLRRAAVRLDEEQQRLARSIAPGRELAEGDAENARRGQAAITERLAREREALGRLRRRMQDNRFEDSELDALVSRAGELLEEAGRRSVEASGAVEQVARAEESGDGATEQQRSAAAAKQNEVRDALEDLADLLDQGQDTWALRRSIERALQDQRALRDRTAAAAARTAGKGASELSPQERAALEQIASEQEDLAHRTDEALQRMQERLEDLKRNDPAAARAVEQAAERGRQRQVPTRMQEAAEQARQNQGNSAVSQQDSAIQALEEMLEAFDQAGASQDEELRRLLATLIQTLEQLVKDQAAQIGALERAEADRAYAPLVDPMIALNRNTLAALDEANAGPQDLATVAELIDRAADAQGSAIAALRADPVEHETVHTHEQTSLDRLTEALEEAKRIDEQAAEREAERKAAALKKAYREALAEQVAIEAESSALSGQEPTRRTRALARQLAQRQTDLKDALADLRAQTRELTDTVVFSYAHDRLERLMTDAAATLGTGTADAMVVARQRSAIRILQSLIEALDNRRQRDDDFRDSPDAGSGSGGGSGSTPMIPPLAEVRLLRAMQIEAAEMTRLAGEVGDAAAVAEASTLQSELAERAAALLEAMMAQQQQQQQQQQQPPAPQQPRGEREDER